MVQKTQSDQSGKSSHPDESSIQISATVLAQSQAPIPTDSSGAAA